MTENNGSVYSNNFQSDSDQKSSGLLDTDQLINSLMNLRYSKRTISDFVNSTLSLIASQPEMVQASFYMVDQKTKELALFATQPVSLSPEEMTEHVIPFRSSETLARVAQNAQPFIIPDLEKEIADYQKGKLDPKTRSIFLGPVVLDGQLAGVIDIQNRRPAAISPGDLPGLTNLCRLFSILFSEIKLEEKSGLTHQNLVKYSSVSKEIFASDLSKPLFGTLLQAFQGTDLVAFIFKTKKDNLILEDLFDAKGTGFDASLKGLEVDPGSLLSSFSSDTPVYIRDLPDRTEFGDLVSFFIRRECFSIAALPILGTDSVEEILAIGSRDPEPISSDDISLYEKIIEDYRSRNLLNFRLLRTVFLEDEIGFIASANQLALASTDENYYFEKILTEMRSRFGSDIDLIYLQLDPTGQAAKSYIYSGFDSKPIITEKNLDEDTIKSLIALTDLFNFKDFSFTTDQTPPGIQVDLYNLGIPLQINDSRAHILVIKAGNELDNIRNISTNTLRSLGSITTNFFIQTNLKSNVSHLDQTVSRTVNRQQSLNQISLESSSGRSQLEILSAIPTHLVIRQFCEQSSIFTPSPDGNFEMRVSEGYGEDQRNLVLQPGVKLPGKALESKNPEILRDTSELSREDLINPQNLSGISSPISFGDEVFAILHMEHSLPDQYDEYDRELIHIFCLSIGSLIANLRLVDQVRAQVNRQQNLFEVTSKLRRSLDMESILKTSATEIAKIANASKASIHIKIQEEASTEPEQSLPGGEA